MYKKDLEEKIELIMKEGVPLFNREQIKKMLRRMHDEALATLEIDLVNFKTRMKKKGAK